MSSVYSDCCATLKVHNNTSVESHLLFSRSLQHEGSQQVSLSFPGGALQEAAAAPRAAAAGLPEGVDQFPRVGRTDGHTNTHLLSWSHVNNY